jgi:hypothetical protein
MNEKGIGSETISEGVADTSNGDREEQNGSMQALLSSDGAGGFTIQPYQDGKPAGDPQPAKSLDEAMQSVSGIIGEGGESPAPESSELAPEEAPMPEDVEMANYMESQGTRPRKAPSWDQYRSGGNPLAK